MRIFFFNSRGLLKKSLIILCFCGGASFLPFLLFSWEGAQLKRIDPPYPLPRPGVQISPVFYNPIPPFILKDGGVVVATPQGGLRFFSRLGWEQRRLLIPEPLESSGVELNGVLYWIGSEGGFYTASLQGGELVKLKEGLPSAVGRACALDPLLFWKDAEGGVFATTLTGGIAFRYEGSSSERIAVRGGAGLKCFPEKGITLAMTTQGKLLWLNLEGVQGSVNLQDAQEGFGEQILFLDEDRFFFCAVRSSCFLVRASANEILERFPWGSLDGPHSLGSGWVGILSSEGILHLLDENLHPLDEITLFPEPGWLLPQEKSPSELQKLWAVSLSGKLVEVSFQEFPRKPRVVELARIYPGVNSAGFFLKGLWWIPTGYGSLYLFELR